MRGQDKQHKVAVIHSNTGRQPVIIATALNANNTPKVAAVALGNSLQRKRG